MSSVAAAERTRQLTLSHHFWQNAPDSRAAQLLSNGAGVGWLLFLAFLHPLVVNPFFFGVMIHKRHLTGLNMGLCRHCAWSIQLPWRGKGANKTCQVLGVLRILPAEFHTDE